MTLLPLETGVIYTLERTRMLAKVCRSSYMYNAIKQGFLCLQQSAKRKRTEEVVKEDSSDELDLDVEQDKKKTKKDSKEPHPKRYMYLPCMIRCNA